MSNGYIGDKSWRKTATYSAMGDEDPSGEYPATHLQHDEMARVWRSPDLSLANCKIKIVYPDYVPLLSVGLSNINAKSANDRVKVSHYSDLAMLNLVATSGWKIIFNEVYELGDPGASWDSGNAWDRIHTELDRANRRFDKGIYFEEEISVLVTVIEFDFSDNPDGYVECGIVDPADGFFLPLNYDYNSNWGLQSRTITTTAAGGVDYTQPENADDVFVGNSSMILRQDAFSTFYEWLRRSDTHTFFWWSPDIDDELNAMRHTYLAKNNTVGLFGDPVYNRASVPFSFKRVL